MRSRTWMEISLNLMCRSACQQLAQHRVEAVIAEPVAVAPSDYVPVVDSYDKQVSIWEHLKVPSGNMGVVQAG